MLQGNQVKIQPKSSDKYTTIIKALAEKRTEFHTYQPKADRSFRIVLRRLHYSTDTQKITSEIESLGHTVVNIFNIKQSRTNIQLPLFFVDLKPSVNNKDIYLIETLHCTKVKFGPPRPKRTIPKCNKCHAMSIPKPIASIAPDASNAPVAILPNNVYGKINLTVSNMFSTMVTIQPTTKAALFTKIYRREPSHRFEEDKTANTPVTSSNHIHPCLLLCYCSQIFTHTIVNCRPTTRTLHHAPATTATTTN